jgi:o-succinylbenzoate synthase
VIERLELRPYRLPLRASWRSARGGFTERAGWLVCAHGEGGVGYGDCAPLPAAGTETPQRALAALERCRTLIVGQPLAVALDLICADNSPAPAARFALECALLDLAAQSAALPLRHLLSPRAADGVAVNATLGALPHVTAPMLRESADSGFRVLKIKVGLEPWGTELARLTGLTEGLPPGVGLRLDANGAWTAEEAARAIDGLSALPVESLEEPLRAPRDAELRRLQAAARFPIALDESFHAPRGRFHLETLPVRRLVLKPAALGGLRRALRLAGRARGLGVEVVTTSLIETAAGLWPSLQLAAALASPLAQGLATSGWLARDLGRAPVVRDGRIALPDEPGSGFQPAADDEPR